MKVSLSTRIVLSFVFFVGLILGSVSFLSYSFGRQGLEDAALAEMKILAEEKAAELASWTEERSIDVSLIARQDILADPSLYLGDVPAAKRSAVEERLRQFLPGPHGFYTDLFVMDFRTGKVVASTAAGETGSVRRGAAYFENGRSGPSVQVSRDPDRIGGPLIVASAPVSPELGAPIGVLGIRMDPSKLMAILERGRNNYGSLDTFIVNSERLLVTKPRFLSESDAQAPLSTAAIAMVIEGTNGVIMAPDYRGVRSIAAFHWDASHGLGLIVKIDEEEALAPARRFGWTVLWISLIAMLMALGLAMFLAHSVRKPVLKLRQRVLEFAELGDDDPGSNRTGDEVALLSLEFERMARRVEDRNTEIALVNTALQSEVKERTEQAERILVDQARYSRQRLALIAITEREPSDKASTAEFLTKLSAETLHVERVSIWGFSTERDAIECVDLFCGSGEEQERQTGHKLAAVDYPGYFLAMSESKVIAADHAQTDARTKEFGESYLAPLGITSMLDVPIRVGGAIYGVLCHEHVGPARRWTDDEQSFAVAVAGAFSLAIERSQRISAEATLQAKDERLRAITNAAQDAIVMMDARGLICFWNPAAERTFGFLAEEALGQDLHKLIAPERYHAAHSKAFTTFRKSGCGAAVGKTLELEGLTKAGNEIAVQLSLSSVQVESEWHSIGVIRDVTERKLEMARLRDAHAQLGHIFANTPGIIYRLKLEGHFITPLTVSPNIEDILGYKAEEALNVSWWIESLHPDDREKALNELPATLERGTLRTEYRLRHKDGRYRWMDESRSVISDSTGNSTELIGVVTDITERKAAEATLAESREQYRDLFENATDLIQAIRPDGSIAYVNHAWRMALGYDEDEIANISMFTIIPKEQQEHCLKEMRRAMSGTAVSGVETEFLSNDGRRLSVEGNITCKFVGGEPVHTRGIFHDVTERKAAEQTLREINNGMLLQTAALESTANGVAITDTRGIIEWVNPAFTQLTGYSAKDVIGKNPRLLKSGKNSEGFYNDLWGTISKGDVWHGDLINRRKDGTFYYEEMTITPVRDADGKIGHFVAIKQDVTASRLAEESLRINQAKLAKAQEIAHMGYWEWNMITDEIFWSDEAFRILGLDPAHDQASAATFLERVHPEDRERVKINSSNAIEKNKWENIEYRVIRPDGSHAYVLSEGVFSGDDETGSYRITGIMLDITARRESEDRFRSIVESANDAIILIDHNGEIVSWNEAAKTIFGYERDEVVGRRLQMLFLDTYTADIPDGNDCSPLAVSGVMLPGCRGTAMTGIKSDGEEFPLEITVSSWEAENGNFYSAIVRDITQRKTLEDQLTYQTLHDPLTNLANRVLFQDRLAHAIKKIKRSGATVGVLFIDLDNFKNVNDTLGHSAGDELLIAVADRMKSCLRDGDTAARFGGDEFAVLIEDPTGVEGAMIVAERIRDAVTAPFHLGSNEAHVGTSIGIAVTGPGNETPELLLQNADVAMYIAKTSGKNRYVVFEPHMQEAIVKRVQLETDMRAALQRNEFEVYYQPIVNLNSERVEGMEALVRWNHPTSGLMMPCDFIRIAEETHLIIQLGKWVMEEACIQARIWQKSVAGGQRMTLTVNIATQQFQDDGLLAAVRKALDVSGLPPSSLVLEVTETTMLLDTDKTLKTIDKLRSLGVRLAIDDFGTGYSSLSYLQRFAIDVLKIDKSFIDNIALGDESSAVARAIISMGQSLRMKTIAEGIESLDQQTELQSLGCEYGQGYFFAKPLAKRDMDEYLRTHAAAGALIPPVAIPIPDLFDADIAAAE